MGIPKPETIRKPNLQTSIDKAAQEWIDQGREEKKPAATTKARQTTTIILDADLHTNIKVYCAQQKGMKFNNFVEEALQAYLKLKQ
ncbi:hypothetical protein CAP48_19635 (plasmid) [Advenella sp. S44]|uniref:hypothetical protein n=1 Tax=Advenella sp. S44 TaxID=1982755 RepID=UPI000C2AA68A|nr:hypothetical protein [Advenella sp. S44]PJX20010.1 hypothetical protein CAP48_19635 [Advenella sp. S44]